MNIGICLEFGFWDLGFYLPCVSDENNDQNELQENKSVHQIQIGTDGEHSIKKGEAIIFSRKSEHKTVQVPAGAQQKRHGHPISPCQRKKLKEIMGK